MIYCFGYSNNVLTFIRFHIIHILACITRQSHMHLLVYTRQLVNIHSQHVLTTRGVRKGPGGGGQGWVGGGGKRVMRRVSGELLPRKLDRFGGVPRYKT